MVKLHAYFDSMCEARKAAKILDDMGYGGVHLDLAGAFDYEYSAEISASAGESAPNLSSLVLKMGDRLSDIGKAPFFTPGVSVGAIGCTEDCRDVGTKLLVNLDESKAEEVKSIIRENGGRIFSSYIE